MKHCFIINPVAGKINKENCKNGIERVCSKRGLDYKIFISERKGDVRRIACEAITAGFKYIYAIGGDGTVNEAANSVIAHAVNEGKNDVVLIPVASGTGNDFVRSFDTAEKYKRFVSNIRKCDARKRTDCGMWEKYVSAAIDGEIKNIDCAKVNDMYFINIASMGMDACVVYNAVKYKQSKFIPDGLAYFASVITTFLHYRPFVFDISIDGGEPRKGEYTLIAVANGRCYGGGIIPAPDADLFSGKFEVCIADKIVKHQVIRFFPKYAKGKHAGLDIVNIKSCKKITVSSKETIYLNADGEIFETEKAEFEILDIKLPVSVLR